MNMKIENINLQEKFKIEYTDADDNKQTCIIYARNEKDAEECFYDEFADALGDYGEIDKIYPLRKESA